MSWGDCFYAGTQVSPNNESIISSAAFELYERRVSAGRILQLRKKPIPGNFDLKHMQAMHRHLFQDVYPWAGELRSVDMTKDGNLFTFKAFLQRDGADIGEFVRNLHYLRGLDKARFATQLAEVYARLIILHPFREGNGLIVCAYLTQLAQEAGYRFEYDKTDSKEWARAAIAATRGSTGGLRVDRDLQDLTPIEHIMMSNLKVERALAFENLPRGRALAMCPELDGAIGVLDEARNSGKNMISTFEGIIHELRAGHLVGEGSHDQSLEAVQLAAQTRGAYLRNASGRSDVVEGRVIGVSSHHVAVRGDDDIALYFERAKLDRAVYANDKVSILAERDKCYVFENGKEFLGATLAGREIEKIDFTKSGIGEGCRYSLNVTLVDGSARSFTDIDRHGLNEALGKKQACFLAIRAEEGGRELFCYEPLPPIDGEQVIVGQTYTGLILSADHDHVIQLTDECKIVVHNRAHLSGSGGQFQTGERVSISYPYEHIGLVCAEKEQTVYGSGNL